MQLNPAGALRCSPVWLAVVAVASLLMLGLADTIHAQGWSQRAESTPPGWRRQTPADATAPKDLDLHAADDPAEKIEAGREDVQDGQIRSTLVTDVIVRLRPDVRRYRPPAREHGREAATEHTTTSITAQIQAVTQGRVTPTGTARCDRFDGNVLICTVECEGGMFGLRRGQRPGEHFLIVGITDNSPAAYGAGLIAQTRAGFRLGACGRQNATQTSPQAAPPPPASALLLMPRGGRLATEIRLIEQR